jgi:hypothetical protein
MSLPQTARCSRPSLVEVAQYHPSTERSHKGTVKIDPVRGPFGNLRRRVPCSLHRSSSGRNAFEKRSGLVSASASPVLLHLKLGGIGG